MTEDRPQILLRHGPNIDHYSDGTQKFNLHKTDYQEEFDVEEIDISSIESKPNDIILCMLYNNSYLGAAYFDLNTFQLYILSDMDDYGPEFNTIRLVMRFINPKYIIAMGSACEEYIKCIIDVLNTAVDSISYSDQLRNIPENLFLLSYIDYAYEACKHRLLGVDLIVNKTRNFDISEKEVYLHSVIDFDNKQSVHALAALIKFTEKKWLHIFYNNKEPISFMNIIQTSLRDYTFMDHVSFNALQIFENTAHDFAVKRQEKNSRRGFSIFKLFSQYCKTKVGCITARNLMMNPISKLETLNLRLNFIDFAANPKYKQYIDDLEKCIKCISNVQTHLLKIQHSRAKGRHWKMIHTTIYNILLIQESAKSYSDTCDLLKLLTDCNTEPLYGFEHCITKAIDLNPTNLSRKPLIRNGVDETLDAKRLQRQDISRNVTAAANYMHEMIAANIDVNLITYIPNIGHIIVTRDKILDETLDFHLYFQLKGYYHYKNPLCEELDNNLGDIQKEILEYENRILENLTNVLIDQCIYLFKPLEYLALMDCLISVAKVSVEHGFVRPILNECSIYDIVQGFHPLLGYNCNNYVRNDWNSDGNTSKVKVITGPNGSGKTVYLKQIGVLVYLAHLGFYISAESAKIGIAGSIYSRLYAMESASLKLSSFQIDLTQMGHILHKAKGNSLVLIDEFGKGSTGREGLHLLTGSLRLLLESTGNCPHILISTHYESISRFLPHTPIISFHRIKVEINDNELPIFLFKIEEGESSSLAIEVAKGIGMSNMDLLDDSEHFLYCLRSGIQLRNNKYNLHNRIRDTNYINIDYFEKIVMPDLEVE